jgi:hypothetical protein
MTGHKLCSSGLLWSCALLQKLTVVQWKKEWISFMKPEGSTRSSQEMAGGSRPQRDETSEYHHILIAYEYLISQLYLRFDVWIYRATKIFVCISCLSHTQRLLHFLIWSPYIINKVNSKDYQVLHCAIFFTFLLLPSSKVYIFLSALFSSKTINYILL